jgi:hypothetical protein
MTKSIGYVLVCLLGLAGCSFERYDDCDADFDHQLDDDSGSGARAGSKAAGTAGSSSHPTGGSSATGGGGSSAAGESAGNAGSAGTTPAPNSTCEDERDCDAGFNCDLETHECVAADAETCPELKSESACTNRRDCVPIYGGINCSCGQDCECMGGEPGCICESFDFFACQSGA